MLDHRLFQIVALDKRDGIAGDLTSLHSWATVPHPDRSPHSTDVPVLPVTPHTPRQPGHYPPHAKNPGPNERTGHPRSPADYRDHQKEPSP